MMTFINARKRSKLIAFSLHFISVCSIIIHSTVLASESDNSSTEPGVILTQIADPPKNTKVILGLTAKLSCGVKNDAQTSVNLEWYFGRLLISKTTPGRIQVLEDGTLKIEQARNTDVGVYNCSVTSDKGTDWKNHRSGTM